jgi:uncharacterized membrane protein
MNPLILAAMLSILPVAELRAGLPFAFASGVNPWIALAVCVLANMAIVPIVFLFLEFVHSHFLHIGAYRTAFDRFMERTRQKVKPSVDKYGYWGLAVFVAIPLPLTGAYTGALAAWFFGMNKWKAFLSIAVGVAIAGAIVLAVLLTGATAWQWVKA